MKTHETEEVVEPEGKKRGYVRSIFPAMAASLLVLVVLVGMTEVSKLVGLAGEHVSYVTSNGDGKEYTRMAEGEEYGILLGTQEEAATLNEPAQSTEAVPDIQIEGDYSRANMSINYTYLELDRVTYIAVNGKLLEDTIGARPSDIAMNLDQSIAIITCPPEGVFMISADGLSRIADYANTVEISPDGSRGMYAAYDGIYVFDTANATQPIRIDDFQTISGVHFSPDNKTLIYGVINVLRDPSAPSDTNSFSLSHDLKVYMNGEIQVIEDAYGIGTSNDGEYIYYIKPSEGAMYVTNMNTGSAKKIGDYYVKADGTPYDYPVVNEAGTEMIYPTKDSICYVEKDGEPITIGSASTYQIRMIKPLGTPYYDTYIEDLPSYESYVEGSVSLRNKVYESGGQLIYLDDNAQATCIAERTEYKRMDLYDLYYTQNGGEPIKVAFGVDKMTGYGQGLGKSMQFCLGYYSSSDATYLVNANHDEVLKLLDSKYDSGK